MDVLSELNSPEETFKLIFCERSGEDESNVQDLRIIIIYRTAPNGFMIGAFLKKNYRIVFLSENWLNVQIVNPLVGISTDDSLVSACQAIGEIIGATLISTFVHGPLIEE